MRFCDIRCGAMLVVFSVVLQFDYVARYVIGLRLEPTRDVESCI